jgi:hypothetical protein
MNRTLRLTPLVLLVLSGVAFAQQPVKLDGYTTISPTQLKRLGKKAAGKRYSLPYLRFHKAFNGELKLWGGLVKGRTVKAPLVGLLRITGGLEKLLTKRQDFRKQALVPKVTNVQVLGVMRKVRGNLVFLVEKVFKLETHSARFERLAKALPEKDAAQRRALARQVEVEVRTLPKDVAALTPLVQRLRAEARAITIEALPVLPEGAEQRIKVGVQVKDIELVAEVWAHEGVEQAIRDQAATALHDQLQARLHMGSWRPYGELKRELGFLPLNRRWVRQEEVWLQAAVTREKARLKRSEPRQPFTRPMMLNNMNEGKVLRGMEKEWVIAALKVTHGETTYPVSVHRSREPQKRSGELVWEVWVMPSGFQVYFCNGLVTEKFSPKPKGGSGEKEKE